MQTPLDDLTIEELTVDYLIEVLARELWQNDLGDVLARSGSDLRLLTAATYLRECHKTNDLLVLWRTKARQLINPSLAQLHDAAIKTTQYEKVSAFYQERMRTPQRDALTFEGWFVQAREYSGCLIGSVEAQPELLRRILDNTQQLLKIEALLEAKTEKTSSRTKPAGAVNWQGLEWEQVEMILDVHEGVFVHSPLGDKNISRADFARGREKGKLPRLWETLTTFAAHEGHVQKGTVPNLLKQKNVSDLRKRLIALLGIQDNPIPPWNEAGCYRTRFTIHLTRLGLKSANDFEFEKRARPLDDTLLLPAQRKLGRRVVEDAEDALIEQIEAEDPL